MLYEAPPFYMINGVSVLRDHADPLQFYYQPLGPRLVSYRDGVMEVPQLLLIKFRSAAGSGGFLDFDVHLGLTEQELAEVSRELRHLADLPAPPRLSPVPVVDGSVQLMLLGAESGAAAPPAGAGAASAASEANPGLVRSIHHAAKPALYGDNRAAFSVELDERGVTIMDQAMRGEMAPIGVVYALDYLALRPAYHVHLQIDWDRVQDTLDTSYGHEGLFTDIQIKDTVDKLVENRTIRLEVDTFVPEDEGGTFLQRRDAAVARVRDMITDAFFQSTLNLQRELPDGWDKARDIIKSFSPQRSSILGVFSYRKVHYTRIDQKRLDVDFSERVTLKRSMYPQGHLSGLFRQLGQGLDLNRIVLPVTAEDPWFSRRKVRVISRADFQNDPIRSLTATLTYDGRTRTVLLDKDKPEEVVEWPSVVRDGRTVEPVRLSFTAELKPAEAGERPNCLSSAPEDVLGESRELEPHDLFSIETIPVLTLPDFPFDRYPQVEVQLRYQDPAHGIRQEDMIRLTKEAPNGSWQRFLVGPPAAPVMAKFIYRAADHRDRETSFASLLRPQVDVADPSPQRLKVSIVSALNFTQVDRAFVDLAYDDPANAVHAEDSIEIAKDKPPRPFVVDRVDPAQSRVRYRVTILMLDSTVFEGPWSTTLASRIFVRSDIKGHRAVTLRAPADFAAKGLERIEVEARAHDDVAGLSFADRFDLTAPGATAIFEFEFLDPANHAFEFRIRRLFRNGMSTQEDWRRFDQDEVIITAT